MNRCRPFLLGTLALGLLTGLAVSQQPATPPDCTADEPRRDGLLGGVGLYLLQPYFGGNLAYTAVRDVGKAGDRGFTRADSRTEVRHDLAVSPQAWIGYLDECGWGGRVRYWHLRQGTGQELSGSAPRGGGSGSAFFSAAPLGLQVPAFSNEGLSVTTKLELNVLDLEGVRAFRAGGCDLLFSAGARLAWIDQSYNAFLSTQGRTIDAVLSGHNFNGAGPVVAGELRCPLCDCGVSLYGGARGSLLFGSARQDAVLLSQNSAGSDHRDRSMFVGEAELGAEYGGAVGDYWLFGQVALVGQNWFGAGGAARAVPNVVPGGAVNGSYVQDSDLGFLGVSFRLGVTY